MKKNLTLILTLIFIISMSVIVNAATGGINVGASSENVIKGKTFTVTITGTADNNITGMEAKFSYDSSKLVIEKKEAGTGFADMSGNSEIAIASTNNQNISKTGVLYAITFKVLDTAPEGETTINVTDAVLALLDEQGVQVNTEKSSGSVTINIKEDDTTVGGQDGATEDGDKGNGVGNKDDGNKGNNAISDKNGNNANKKPGKLPQTGAESASIIAIVALGFISIISFISYKKYKNI